jgi:hypothetical protein
MKTDDYIDELIKHEKETACNPYLATRVMAGIETSKKKSSGIFQYVVAVASISLVVLLGIAIGNSYVAGNEKYAGININDSEIENFELYKTMGNE